MLSKNIKKALMAKINNWCKHVDDEEIVKTIKENVIVTGGSIVSMLLDEEVNDYDVYFKTKESCRKVAEYYCKKFNETHKSVAVTQEVEDGRIRIFISSKGIEEETNGITDESEPIGETESYIEEHSGEEKQSKPRYRPIFLSTNAITLSDKIQIVIRFYGEPNEIHKNYDFVHCTCWYTYSDDTLELPARALEAIINKELFYVGSKYPLCSIIRSRKFIQRGWSINAGQYLKMALQLNELNLKDLNVFEEQLVGVDSAYFSQAIEAIKNKQEENPDFKVDNTYLFEIINRIF